jgi:hypothetical protein
LIEIVDEASEFRDKVQAKRLAYKLDRLSIIDYWPAIHPFHRSHEAFSAEMGRHSHCSSDFSRFEHWSHTEEYCDPFPIISLNQIHMARVLDIGVVMIVDDGIYTLGRGFERSHG